MVSEVTSFWIPTLVAASWIAARPAPVDQPPPGRAPGNVKEICRARDCAGADRPGALPSRRRPRQVVAIAAAAGLAMGALVGVARQGAAAVVVAALAGAAIPPLHVHLK